MRKCTKCELDAVNGSKCRQHYNEYMKEYNLKRYYRVRSECVEALGGKCVRCGTTESLEFDHIDRHTKSFDVGKLLNYSKAKRDSELLKCQLLCTQCHILKGDEYRDQKQVGHGEGLSGKRNCPCKECKARKAEYMKNYK